MSSKYSALIVTQNQKTYGYTRRNWNTSELIRPECFLPVISSRPEDCPGKLLEKNVQNDGFELDEQAESSDWMWEILLNYDTQTLTLSALGEHINIPHAVAARYAFPLLKTNLWKDWQIVSQIRFKLVERHSPYDCSHIFKELLPYLPVEANESFEDRLLLCLKSAGNTLTAQKLNANLIDIEHLMSQKDVLAQLQEHLYPLEKTDLPLEWQFDTACCIDIDTKTIYIYSNALYQSYCFSGLFKVDISWKKQWKFQVLSDYRAFLKVLGVPRPEHYLMSLKDIRQHLFTILSVPDGIIEDYELVEQQNNPQYTLNEWFESQLFKADQTYIDRWESLLSGPLAATHPVEDFDTLPVFLR